MFLVPWAIEPAMVIDTFDKQGNPIELSPRNVLKEDSQALRRQGLGSRSSRRRWSST